MRARRTEPLLVILLLLGAIGVSACTSGDCGDSEPREVVWDGVFSRDSVGGEDGTMTIDLEKGVVRVESEDKSGRRIVTTWKIRSGAEYDAARTAKSPK